MINIKNSYKNAKLLLNGREWKRKARYVETHFIFLGKIHDATVCIIHHKIFIEISMTHTAFTSFTSNVLGCKYIFSVS